MAQAVTHRTFTLEARDGEVVRGDVRLPGGASRPTAAVVIVHGFKGFKDWAFFPHLAERIAEGGHAAVSFNFSRNGVGEDLEHFTELEKFGANTLSLETAELDLVLERVRAGSLLGFVPDRIGLLGHSRGGGQAVLAAARHADVASLVTWASVASFDRWTDDAKRTWRSDGRIWVANARTRQQMPLDVTLLEDFEANRDRLDVRAAAARVEAPWLVVHGSADETVDVSDAHALVGSAPSATLRIVPGAGHTFEARHPFEHVPPQLADALEASLAHFARTLHGSSFARG